MDRKYIAAFPGSLCTHGSIPEAEAFVRAMKGKHPNKDVVIYRLVKAENTNMQQDVENKEEGAPSVA